MTSDQRDLFIDTADQYGIDAEPYEGEYSGRGMYGKMTFAVVIEKEKDAHWVAGIMTGMNPGSPVKVRTDNLGMEWVVY